MEDALWTRFARLAWVRGSLVKYVIPEPLIYRRLLVTSNDRALRYVTTRFTRTLVVARIPPAY